MFGEGCADDDWPEPFIAARCDDDMTALSAALEGSSVCSAMDLSWATWVGEAFFGVAPMRILRCEYCRFTPGPEPGGGVGAGGDIVASYVNAWPPEPLRFGNGVCWSLTRRRAGSMSSLSRLKSSVIRRRSCSKRFILSSLNRSCSTRCLMSLRVAVAY